MTKTKPKKPTQQDIYHQSFKEMQIKTTNEILLDTYQNGYKILTENLTAIGKYMEQLELSYVADANVK